MRHSFFFSLHLMCFDTVLLAFFLPIILSRLFFLTVHKHPLYDGIADIPKSPSVIKASICSVRTLTDCYASKALRSSLGGTA